MIPGGGEVGSCDGIVERGGRAVVEDEHGDSGRPKLRRGWLQVARALDWRWGEELVAGGSRKGEFDRRPSGGEVLVTGALVLPRSR